MSEDDFYEVESIVAKKYFKKEGKEKYLIKWKN